MGSLTRPSLTTSARRRWSVCAGLFMFLCGTVSAYILSDLLLILGDAIGLPAPFALVIMASLALVIGSSVWWIGVERRRSETYVRGGLCGLLTGSLTGLLWTGRLVTVWGIEVLRAETVMVLVTFVLGIATVAGWIAGLVFTSLRRWLDGELIGNSSLPG